MVDRCICCGEIIPEGRMACPNCLVVSKKRELIDKWDVVNSLIRIQNAYQFYKNVWDADVLYRRIAELEIGIGKTPAVDAVEVVRCKDCKHRYYSEYQEMYCCERWADGFDTVVCKDDFCSYGERKDNG